MLKKEYIKENLLKRKLTVQDEHLIHEKIREWYYESSEWNIKGGYEKLLAIEMKKLIELYIMVSLLLVSLIQVGLFQSIQKRRVRHLVKQ